MHEFTIGLGNHRSTTEVDLTTGGWSLPLYSSLPVGVTLQFEIANATPVEVYIPFSAIASLRLKQDPIEVRAESTSDSSGKSCPSLKVADTLNISIASLLRRTSLGDAHAQPSPPQSSNPPANEDTPIEIAKRLVPNEEIRGDKINCVCVSGCYRTFQLLSRRRAGWQTQNTRPTHYMRR